jgi:hypothetical protein
VVLAVGVFCGFWGTATGRRLRQGDTDTLSQRVRFACAERKLTRVGSTPAIVSVVLQALGH